MPAVEHSPALRFSGSSRFAPEVGQFLAHKSTYRKLLDMYQDTGITSTASAYHIHHGRRDVLLWTLCSLRIPFTSRESLLKCWTSFQACLKLMRRWETSLHPVRQTQVFIFITSFPAKTPHAAGARKNSGSSRTVRPIVVTSISSI